MGKIWVRTPQNRTYRAWEPRRLQEGFEVFKVSASYPVRLGNRTYRAWEPRRLQEGFEVFKVSASYPVRLGNRTYRAWEPRRLQEGFEVFKVSASYPVRLGMQTANVKQRQILPRVGKIWVRTPQNRTYRAWRMPKLTPMVRRKTAPTGPGWTVWLMRYKLLELV